MNISITGDVKSLIIDGVEMVKKKTTNLADEFKKYLGTKEYEGIVKTIQTWYYGTLVKDAWCATALSYFANICGIGKQTGKHENVDRMKDYMKARGKIQMSLAYGGTYKPKKGDVVFFSSKHIYDDCTHVATVQSVSGNTITWIGGNTNDSIMTKTNDMKNDKYVVCFGVIDY